jgi:hypothetical protein
LDEVSSVEAGVRLTFCTGNVDNQAVLNILFA